MRQIRPGVRVILTSGFNRQDAVTRFTGKGLAGFVQKPFELAALTQVIRGVLEGG
jgi:DNA-binding NtrC family response regulator